MDVGIRFWNSDGGLVETRYYDSQFLRRPNVANLLSCLTDSMNHLDSDKLLQLAVNWQNSEPELHILVAVPSI